MAGRFLSLEEAARQLGVTVDEVNRLVDRKKLFPMRDGATVKFKAEDIERTARELGADSSPADDLALDLDLPASADAALEELSLGAALDGGESIFSTDLPEAKGSSQTIVRGDEGGAPVSGLSAPSLAGGADIVFDSSAGGSGLTMDLGNLGSGGAGSLGGLAAGSAAGAALSGVVDSGLSLEDGDVQLSGIDIGGTSGIGGSAASVTGGGSGASVTGGGSLLGGDEFQLGSDTPDDESASVVIATEETGDSSFFGAAIEGEGSNFSEDLSAESGSVILAETGEYAVETPFSPLQITGLVCCSLLLLCGGFVMYDLVRTIGSPEGPTLANPLLNAMAETFGWR